MDNSMISNSNSLSPKERTVDSPEESSWTSYFEEFFCKNNDHEQIISSLSLGHESPSLVSDAGSSQAKKVNDADQVVGFSLDKYCKSLSFKKRKTRRASSVEDALEDTASSPVNSPKVSWFNQSDMEQKENNDILEEKGNASGQIDEGIHSANIGRDSDHTELKKRGLCLLPVEMLSNYFG